MSSQPPCHRNGSPKAGDEFGVTHARNRSLRAVMDDEKFVAAIRRQPDGLRASAGRPLASAMTFERQLELVRQGANIIEVRPIRRAEPMFTLGGVSSMDGAAG